MPRPKRKSDLLTNVELEFMKVLWSIGQGSVRDVLENLRADDQRAYTSVATVLRVLVEKDYLEVKKRDRTYVYIPSIDRVHYERRTLKSIANNLFNGTPTELVARLVDDEEINEDTIEEIRNIIDTRFGR